MESGKGKALIVIGLGAAGAAALAALTGGSAHAAEAEQPRKLTPSKVPARVALAKKFAKVFSVPLSLVLSVIAAQSSNRANAFRANKRGGAWGYGQITLATATEIWPKARAKIGKTWDGSGKGLLDPTINIGLTAYYLSLWWKRYRKHRLGWLLSAYAYILGPGRVRKAMPDDLKGKLPSPLPADFSAVKKRMAAALATNDVRRALTEEASTPALSGLGADLYGKALANTLPSTTTGNQARTMFGRMTAALSKAYNTLQNYDPSGIAQATKLDAGSIQAAREYLDSTNAMLQKYYPSMPVSDQPLTSDQLAKLKTAVSTSSVAVKTVDDLFGTPWFRELAGEIAQATKTVIEKVNTSVGFSAGMIAAGAIGVGVLILAIKK